PFCIGLYASPDGVALGQRLELLTADGAAGDHTITLVPYFEDPGRNYYLLAKIDANDSINETHEDNNAALFAGGSYLLDDSVSGQNILEIQQNTSAQAVTLSTADGSLTLGSQSLAD